MQADALQPISVREHDSQQIAAVIEQYRRGFATLDVTALTAIWDQEYDHIIYIAQELAQPVQGWVGVERYYQRVASFLERVSTMEVSDVLVDILGDIASAFLRFHFEGEINGRPHIADGRVTFLLRRTSGAWKVIHYHESRPGEHLSEI
jgi:ketosteroid isomerase-like protein